MGKIRLREGEKSRSGRFYDVSWKREHAHQVERWEQRPGEEREG